MGQYLIVAQKYKPHIGGTANFVQTIAEGLDSAGHKTIVLADNGGEDHYLNNVLVTSNFEYVLASYNAILIIDSCLKTYTTKWLEYTHKISSPIYYWLLENRYTVNNCQSIGEADCVIYYSELTKQMLNHFHVKGHYVPPGINIENSIQNKGQSGITTEYYMSASGYWAHKRHNDLARIFNFLQYPILINTGCCNEPHIPQDSDFVRNLIINEKEHMLKILADSQCYIMHSLFEGFGLILLEAMINKVPWYAYHTGGAIDLQHWGFTYTHNDELIKAILNNEWEHIDVQAAYEYAVEHHSISNMISALCHILPGAA